MGGEWKRILLWSFWVANLLVNSVYVIMCFATADNLIMRVGEVKISGGIESWKDFKGGYEKIISNEVWRAPIAACILGGLMVLVFNILSCVILVRKSINKTGPGFGYGFIVAWCFVLSFFTLLCGVIMEGFKPTVNNELQPHTGWSSIMTGAFIGTYVFSYICCVMFMIFFLCLLIFQGAVTKELGIYEQMQQHKRLLEMNALVAQSPLARQHAI